MIPKIVNETEMFPLGKLSVTLSLGNKNYLEDIHIYPNVCGTLISWKACKALQILPPCYPQPILIPTIHEVTRAPHTELDLLEEQQIIAPITTATEWCIPIVVTPKKNTDRIQLCVDLSHLNRYVCRERYQSSTPSQAVADIAATNAKYFTVLNALKGYHQCPLDQESEPLTTFITPFGRYKYLCAPYGISSISEHYDRSMAEAFTGLTGFRRVVDDIIIYDSDKH